jgi:hypothetical protein
MPEQPMPEHLSTRTPEHPTPVPDLPLARAVAEAVRASPGVRGLSAGADGVAATHGPGERVEGVRLLADEPGLRAEVYLVLDTYAILPAAAAARSAALRAAAAAGQPLARVDIFVDDVQPGTNGR